MVDCSIIIPVYNRASLTRQCLNRLLDDSASSAEIIVIDDASTDITPELLKSYGARIRVITHSVNRGFAQSCNQGASIANGNFLIFLNNDTLSQKGWLENLYGYGLEHPQAAMVGAKLLYPDDTVQHAGVVICEDQYPRHIYAGFPTDHPAVNTSRRFQVVTAACALVRRDIFTAFQGFDTRYLNGYEDVDLCLRMGAAGHEIHFCHTAVLHHLESVSRNLEPLAQNLQLYRAEWYDRVVPDEFRYYLEDGLIEVSYSPAYPIHLTISPLLSTLSDPTRTAKLEHLLHLRALQSSRQRREFVQVIAELGDMQRVQTLRAQSQQAASNSLAVQLHSRAPFHNGSLASNRDEDLIYPDAENLMGGHFLQVGGHMADLLKTYGRLLPTDRVLEVGSGYGRIAFPLLHYLEQASVYQGFDVMLAQVEWCQTQITPRYPNFRFRHADIYNKAYNPDGKCAASDFHFPYPDAAFDFVYLASVFTHMLPEDVDHYLSEIGRVLVPNGRCLATFFLLNDESHAHMSGEWDFPYNFGVYRSQHESTPEHAVAYDEEFVRGLFAKHGFELIEPIGRGWWSGRDNASTLQDFIVARKHQTDIPRPAIRTPQETPANARPIAQGRIQLLNGDSSATLYSILMPVKNGAKLLAETLPRVLSQAANGRIEIIAIDSGSTDDTIEVLKQYEATIVAIPAAEFNHGLTRNLLANYAHGAIFIFLNQSALPTDEYWLTNLVAPLEQDPNLAGVCSRLVPRADANLLARRDVLRDPSGAATSRVSRITNWYEYQALDPDARRHFINFHSISAAIRPEVLERIPFPYVPLIGEDLTWAKEVLEAGYSLRQEASSAVYHSHAYSYTELLQRNFDDAVLNRALVGREIDAASALRGIVATLTGDWAFLEQADELDAAQREQLRIESVMHRTAQWVGQYLGGHLNELPDDAVSHLALTATTKRA